VIPSPALASIVAAVLAIPAATQAQQRSGSLDHLGHTTFIEGFSLSPDGRFAVPRQPRRLLRAELAPGRE
jgi:hypothetical protein